MLAFITKIKDAFLSNNFVYNKLRPFVAGRPDYASLFQPLRLTPDDTVLDIGCGFGFALEYLHGFKAYHGFDIDGQCIRLARANNTASNVHFYQQMLGPQDLEAMQPTKAVAIGLLHHLADRECRDLLAMLQHSPIQTLVTLDTLYCGNLFNDVLSRLDRGRHVRTADGYKQILDGYDYTNAIMVSSNPNIKYFTTAIALQGSRGE